MPSCLKTLVGLCASCRRYFDNIIATGLKLDELAKKVVSRELETIDVLANATASSLTAE